MKKGNLELLYNVLKECSNLSLSEARVRDAFLRKVEEFLNPFYEDRTKICLKFCNKKEDGSPVLSENDEYAFQGTVVAEFTEEMNLLSKEKVELAITPEMITFIEKTSYKPKPGQTEFIDEIIALGNAAI